jgi:hypothetical protein
MLTTLPVHSSGNKRGDDLLHTRRFSIRSMQQPIIVRKQKIDLGTWERNALFNFFRVFSEPFHGVCIRVDCTATYSFAKGR